MKVYVASSWRNEYQPEVVRALRDVGHEVYDFRDEGFPWSDIDLNWESWTTVEYLAALDHPIAEAGFARDFDAMKWADACVMVMPCGRSAHLEAGYFVGTHKPLIILLKGTAEAELMYSMAYAVCGTIPLAIEALNEGHV